jgi:hypothetical protein
MSSQNYYPPPASPIPPPPPDWQPMPPPRRRNRAGKTIAALIVVLLLLFLIFFTPIGTYMFSGLTGNSYASSSSFTLTRTITIDMNREISYACDIPVPGQVSFSGTTAQSVTDTHHSPMGATTSRYGGTWLEWIGTESGRVTLSLTTEATVNTIIWDIDGRSSGMASEIDSAAWALHLDNEWNITDDDGNPTGEFKIWPTHPTIVNLASQLTSEELTVYENLKSVYDYLRKNLEYETIPGQEAKSCLATLQDRTGDCDDQSILLISLLRAAGIPSWLAFGTLYDGVRGEWGAHAWAEIRIPLADGGEETVVVDMVNFEFLVRNCNRLEEWKSDGDGQHLNDYYQLLAYNYTSRPNQPAPVVTISDVSSGAYQASKERVYAFMLEMPKFICEVSDTSHSCKLQRKVF